VDVLFYYSLYCILYCVLAVVMIWAPVTRMSTWCRNLHPVLHLYFLNPSYSVLFLFSTGFMHNCTSRNFSYHFPETLHTSCIIRFLMVQSWKINQSFSRSPSARTLAKNMISQPSKKEIQRQTSECSHQVYRVICKPPWGKRRWQG